MIPSSPLLPDESLHRTSAGAPPGARLAGARSSEHHRF
jgi:hypothetical protein